jgi:hypothetical protein
MYCIEIFAGVKRKMRKKQAKNARLCGAAPWCARISFGRREEGKKRAVFVDIIWWAWYKKLKKTTPEKPDVVRKKDYARKRGNVK